MRLSLFMLASLVMVGTGRATTNEILLTTLNCHWFFGHEARNNADKPLSREEYSLKAGHLIGLLPKDAPLFEIFAPSAPLAPRGLLLNVRVS